MSRDQSLNKFQQNLTIPRWGIDDLAFLPVLNGGRVGDVVDRISQSCGELPKLRLPVNSSHGQLVTAQNRMTS